MKIFVKDGYLSWENDYGTYDCCSVVYLSRVYNDPNYKPSLRSAAWILDQMKIDVKVNACGVWDYENRDWKDVKENSPMDIELFIMQCRMRKTECC